MEKFIIIWDAGYGESADIIEAESAEEANRAAYEAWREDAESNADYRAKPYSKELARDYDLENDEDDL